MQIWKKEKKKKRDNNYNEWPSGLYPVANRGLKGSWTDHSSTKDGRNQINYMKDVWYNIHEVNTNHTSNGCP